MQASGVGESYGNIHCVMRLLMTHQYEDNNGAIGETEATEKRCTFVRPSRLVDDDAKDIHGWPDSGKGVPIMCSITRDIVAKLLVENLDNTKRALTLSVVTKR
jgi:hypothetical protein